ncbi:hypothetical protein CALVIDRAFT_216857 [Calocera viscosa TUFC12733]|uniref:Uncharacterized protein n=1 Tax=Calocera viscosa (strain TUFC12733) TaxID=1330018 RepID=A0A167RH04_CALVF|nr:hypothetical protein CALVIDRAFT_216857 [Calocera viscosa TUFC12733]
MRLHAQIALSSSQVRNAGRAMNRGTCLCPVRVALPKPANGLRFPTPRRERDDPGSPDTPPGQTQPGVWGGTSVRCQGNIKQGRTQCQALWSPVRDGR